MQMELFDDRTQGPALDAITLGPDEMAQVINEVDPPADVQIPLLTQREFAVVLHSLGVALFAHHPDTWLPEGATDAMAQHVLDLLAGVASRSSLALTSEEATRLKEKFGTLVEAQYKARGVDVDELQRSLAQVFADNGIPLVPRDADTDTLDR